jgi:hypothetical protein
LCRCTETPKFDGFRHFVYAKPVETLVFGYALLTCLFLGADNAPPKLGVSIAQATIACAHHASSA